jgi:FtsP/CotA-like multicopper oxidase with cupredoxin domain
MAWLYAQRKRTYPLPLAVMGALILVGALVLSGSPPVANPAVGIPPQAVDLNPDPTIFETALVATEAQVDLGRGVLATAQTFNGTVPGPEFRLKVGDHVIVHFTNNLPIPASIHWHGIELTNRSDGTGVTQDAVRPGGTFTYEFSVPRPGIFFYHSHFSTTNPMFKGYYGSIIVEEPVEARLQGLNVLPPRANTLTMVLAETTVCKEPGANDDVVFPRDRTGTVPWAGNGLFPGKPGPPSPRQLCETPLDDHGHPAGTGPLPAGSIPNIQPSIDCGGAGEAAWCRVLEGQLVLTNGRIPAPRTGSPSAPGALAPDAEVIEVRPGEGMRLQLINAATTRYFRLRLTDPAGNLITLFRVGGQGGVLDNVVVEGGIQGALDTKYDRGELLLPAGAREDVVFVVPSNWKPGSVLTLWTLDFRIAGPIEGNAGFSALPTVPVAHFRITDPLGPTWGRGPRFSIADGNPLRTHRYADSAPVENLKTLPITDSLLDPKAFAPPLPGSASQTIVFTSTPKPEIENVDGTLFDEGAMPPERFTELPHIASSRYAAVGALLELTIKNDTLSNHPWHPHGFSIQPLRIIDATGATLYEFPYNEFVDTVDIPRLTSLVYRVRLDDRPYDFATPTGGALGRWVMHCHIFFHAALGQINELVAVNR